MKNFKGKVRECHDDVQINSKACVGISKEMHFIETEKIKYIHK